jgi:hypothetical protein
MDCDVNNSCRHCNVLKSGILKGTLTGQRDSRVNHIRQKLQPASNSS